MEWNEASGALFAAYPSDGGGMESGSAAGINRPRRPNPANARLEKPRAVMIGEPAPRLIADKAPTEEGILEPATVCKGRPSQADAERLPAVTKAGDGKPGAVGIEIAIAGGVRRGVGVLRTGVAGGGGAIDVGFYPAIEIVGAGGMADVSRGIFRGVEREGLSFGQGGGVLILAEDFDMAGDDVDGAAVVKIIEAEGGVRGGLGGEVAARDAEIIGGRINVERSGALANNECRYRERDRKTRGRCFG